MKRKTPTFKPKPIPVRVDQELLARIDALAIRMREGRSTIMRFAMRIGLENLSKALDAGIELSSLLASARTEYPEPRDEGSFAAETAPEFETQKKKAG